MLRPAWTVIALAGTCWAREDVSTCPETSFLQTRLSIRIEPEIGQPLNDSEVPDFLANAAPPPKLVATSKFSTGNMVALGLVVLAAGSIIGYGLALRFQEDDGSKDVQRDDNAPQRWRVFMSIMLMSMFLLSYADRYNISVAIIEMSEEHGYSKKVQGLIQSAVYAGLLPGNAFFGKMASPDCCGPFAAALVSCFFWSLSTVLTPICADTSIEWLLVIRVLLGFFEAGGAPCLFQLASKWFPRFQSSRMVAAGIAGQCVGAATAMSFGEVTEKDWRIMFYVFGGLGLLWCTFFGLFASDCAETHRFVSEEERLSIRESLREGATSADEPLAITQLIRHPAVLGLMMSEMTYAFVWYFWLSWMPSFFHDEFGQSTGESGTLGMLAYWIAAPACFAWSQIFIQCYRSGRVSLWQCRLTAQAFNLLGSAAGCIALAVCYNNISAQVAVSVVMVVITCLAAKSAGSGPTIIDLGGTANSARIGALSSTFSAGVGAVSNLFIGFCLSSPSLGYAAVLQLCGVLAILGIIAYAVSLRTEPLRASDFAKG